MELKAYQIAALGVQNAVLTYVPLKLQVLIWTTTPVVRVHKPKIIPMIYRVLEFQKLCGISWYSLLELF